jgi:hypothetical protein
MFSSAQKLQQTTGKLDQQLAHTILRPPQMLPTYRSHLHNLGAGRKIEKFHIETHLSRVARDAHCNVTASTWCHTNRQILELTPKELQCFKLKAESNLT